MKVHYQSISHAVSFTLKVPQFCKNTNSFNLKQCDGSKQDLEEITQCGKTYFCYLFRPNNLTREQCVLNFGWNDELEGKQDKFKWLL
jgi:hypothetical protein